MSYELCDILHFMKIAEKIYRILNFGFSIVQFSPGKFVRLSAAVSRSSTQQTISVTFSNQLSHSLTHFTNKPMCGRAAQTITTVRNAALLLNAAIRDGSKDDAPHKDHNSNHLNKSPGQKFTVFTVKTETSTENDSHASSSSFSVTSQSQTKTIESSTKVWGLVRKRRCPNNNNAAAPAPGEHFSSNMFNARSESAHEKPSFRNLFRVGSSCVIPLSGYYEWKVDGPMKNAKKQPYYVYDSIDEKDRRCEEGSSVMFVAGLCETITRAGNGTGAVASSNNDGKDLKMSDCDLSTFTILTTAAHDKLRWLHHRQPVILTSLEDCHCWLNNPSEQLLRELQCNMSRQKSLDSIRWHPVTKRINKVSYKASDCIDRVRTEVEFNRKIKDMFSAQKKRKLISKDNVKLSFGDRVIRKKLSRSSEKSKTIALFFRKNKF